MSPRSTALAALLTLTALGCAAAPPPPSLPPAPPAPPVAALAPPSLLAAPPDFSGAVARIDTRGAGASEPALRRALATRLGEPYDPARIQDDLRALWLLRLFEDVSVEAEPGPSGVALTYVVVVRPRIDRLTFSGLQKVPAAELAAIVTELQGAPADPAAIDLAVHLLREHLSELGHRLARLETEQSRAGQDGAALQTPAQGGVELRFVIDEGPRVVLDRWVFTGNVKVKEAVLRAQMKSGAYNAQGGLYNEDLWARDALLITAHYFDHGMLAAQVGPVEVTASADGAVLSGVVPIVEGPVFHLGKIEIADPAAKKGAPRPAAVLRLKRGEVFNRTRIKEELDRLRAWFAREQHRTVEVSPESELDMTAGRVDLVLRVKDAP